MQIDIKETKSDLKLQPNSTVLVLLALDMACNMWLRDLKKNPEFLLYKMCSFFKDVYLLLRESACMCAHEWGRGRERERERERATEDLKWGLR